MATSRPLARLRSRSTFRTTGREAVTAVLSQVAIIVGLILIWELIVRTFNVSPLIFPAPIDVWQATIHGFQNGEFMRHLGITTVESVVGFLIGAVVGIVLAVIVAEIPRMDKLLYPTLVGLQAVPKLAIAPIIVIWAGYGISSKIIVVSTIAFFPILVNMIQGLQAADREQVDLLRAYGAGRWKVFRLVRLPASLPYLFAGLDVAIVLAVVGAVVAEWVGADGGLGNQIVKLIYTLDIAGMFSILIILSIMGILGHALIVAIQKRVVFWQSPREH